MGKQAAKIKSYFPESTLVYDKLKLTWVGYLQPSTLSSLYQVKIDYKRNKHPDVYVVNPKLIKHKSASALPHVYSTDKQWLCLYYRPALEWNSSKYIADTIIPWTSEWLFHYEMWVITGNWNGGGIEHKTELEKCDE